jgi:hypothetical protein
MEFVLGVGVDQIDFVSYLPPLGLVDIDCNRARVQLVHEKLAGWHA